MHRGLIITGNSSVLLIFDFRFLALEVMFILNDIYHIYRFRSFSISLQTLSICNTIMKIRAAKIIHSLISQLFNDSNQDSES